MLLNNLKKIELAALKSRQLYFLQLPTLKVSAVLIYPAKSWQR